jgi:DNA-binding response OmpR family regulator
MKSILLIEDDPAILNGLKEAFEVENYKISTASDGEKGYQAAKKENFDLILLDLMLPFKDGFEICRDLRKDGIATPIIMLTSKKEEIDKVVGLEIGADDYMTKPFSLKELLARMKAVIRRSQTPLIDPEEISFDNIHLNFKKLEASKNGQSIKLSATEFKIIKYFIQHEGEVVTRIQFLDDVWGYDAFPTTRTVDNYILSIRKKLEDDPAAPLHFITVHSAGYKFQKLRDGG